METNNSIEFNNGTIKVTIVKQHTFSDIEKDILNKLAVVGYYEAKYVNICEEEGRIEHEAMTLLCTLGIAESVDEAWKYTIQVPKDENIGEFYLAILNGVLK